MADEQGPPLVSFAGGAFSGRVESTMRESAQATYYNLLSTDSGSAGTGQTIGSAQITQALGYQIQAARTWFSAAPASAGSCVLPQTSRPFPFAGLDIVIYNTSANIINCYAHPNDIGNSINAQTTNVPVTLGPGTATAFYCFAVGQWTADGIGTGASGSIETVTVQPTLTALGSNQGGAAPITQAMVNVVSTGASQGVILPPAMPGMQIVVNSSTVVGNTPLIIYPSGTQTINGTAGPTGLSETLPFTAPVIFFCFTAGAWVTK